MRVVAHGFLLRGNRAVQVAAALGIFRLADRDGGTQWPQIAKAFLLGRVQPFDHSQPLAGLTVLRQHGDQPQQGRRVVIVQGQCLTIARLGIVQLVLLRLHTTQSDIAFDLSRLTGDGLLQQAARPHQVMVGFGFVSLAQQIPVAIALQRRLPARVAATAGGTLEQFIGVAQAALTLTNDPQTAQRVGVLRLFFESCQKGLLGDIQLVVLKRLETACQVRILLGSHGSRATAVHLRANLGVIRIGLEVLLKQRDLRRSWRTQPHQTLAPTFGSLTTQLGQGRQLTQATNTVGTGRLVAQQQLGQHQFDLGVVRALLQQTLQALARLGPAAGRVTEVVVELQAQLPLRCLARENLPINRHGLVQLARRCQQARLLQLIEVVAALQGDGLFQQQRLRFTGMGLLELIQVAIGASRTVGLELQQAQTVNRIGLLRIDQQQFFPGFGGPDLVTLCLPVLPLLQQRLAGAIERGKAAAVDQGGENPEGYGVTARWHCFSHIGCNFP
ncbi:hypothetical protein D3C84_408140 [compost metagenome]